MADKAAPAEHDKKAVDQNQQHGHEAGAKSDPLDAARHQAYSKAESNLDKAAKKDTVALDAQPSDASKIDALRELRATVRSFKGDTKKPVDDAFKSALLTESTDKVVAEQQYIKALKSLDDASKAVDGDKNRLVNPADIEKANKVIRQEFGRFLHENGRNAEALAILKPVADNAPALVSSDRRFSSIYLNAVSGSFQEALTAQKQLQEAKANGTMNGAADLKALGADGKMSAIERLDEFRGVSSDKTVKEAVADIAAKNTLDGSAIGALVSVYKQDALSGKSLAELRAMPNQSPEMKKALELLNGRPENATFKDAVQQLNKEQLEIAALQKLTNDDPKLANTHLGDLRTVASVQQKYALAIDAADKLPESGMRSAGAELDRFNSQNRALANDLANQLHMRPQDTTTTALQDRAAKAQAELANPATTPERAAQIRSEADALEKLTNIRERQDSLSYLQHAPSLSRLLYADNMMANSTGEPNLKTAADAYRLVQEARNLDRAGEIATNPDFQRLVNSTTNELQKHVTPGAQQMLESMRQGMLLENGPNKDQAEAKMREAYELSKRLDFKKLGVDLANSHDPEAQKKLAATQFAAENVQENYARYLQSTGRSSEALSILSKMAGVSDSSSSTTFQKLYDRALNGGKDVEDQPRNHLDRAQSLLAKGENNAAFEEAQKAKESLKQFDFEQIKKNVEQMKKDQIDLAKEKADLDKQNLSDEERAKKTAELNTREQVLAASLGTEQGLLNLRDHVKYVEAYTNYANGDYGTAHQQLEQFQKDNPELAKNPEYKMAELLEETNKNWFERYYKTIALTAGVIAGGITTGVLMATGVLAPLGAVTGTVTAGLAGTLVGATASGGIRLAGGQQFDANLVFDSLKDGGTGAVTGFGFGSIAASIGAGARMTAIAEGLTIPAGTRYLPQMAVNFANTGIRSVPGLVNIGYQGGLVGAPLMATNVADQVRHGNYNPGDLTLAAGQGWLQGVGGASGFSALNVALNIGGPAYVEGRRLQAEESTQNRVNKIGAPMQISDEKFQGK